MTKSASSMDEYIDLDGDEELDSNLAMDIELLNDPSVTIIDTRRRLEARIAERRLAKELREFDFDC